MSLLEIAPDCVIYLDMSVEKASEVVNDSTSSSSPNTTIYYHSLERSLRGGEVRESGVSKEGQRAVYEAEGRERRVDPVVCVRRHEEQRTASGGDTHHRRKGGGDDQALSCYQALGLSFSFSRVAIIVNMYTGVELI